MAALILVIAPFASLIDVTVSVPIAKPELVVVICAGTTLKVSAAEGPIWNCNGVAVLAINGFTPLNSVLFAILSISALRAEISD